MSRAHPFTEDDLAQLESRGIPVEEAVRQIETLTGPTPYADLDRPARVGDGIRCLGDDEIDELTAVHGEALAAGRVTRFVPASGAATRMFKSLIACRERARPLTREALEADAAAGDADAAAVVEVLDGASRLAFADAWRDAVAARGGDLQTLAREGPLDAVVESILDGDGLGFADIPKGLVPFHAAPGGPRTPFEEHLVEAATALRGDDGTCRLHFTVSAEHRARFEARLAEVAPRIGAPLGARFEVSFSEQKPSTDTIAVADDGAPFRLDDGRLLFRPAGHGALIENLAEAGGDVLFVKNIDNVAPDRMKDETYRFTRALVGCVVDVQRRAAGLLDRLERAGIDESVLDEVEAIARTTLGLPTVAPRDAAARRAFLIDRLDRPVRACGMVRNLGEPGGGPFWVRGADGGSSLQIVEMAQIDPSNPAHREIVDRATHFNPVMIACAVRDRHGRPYDLKRFIDPGAAIVTRKSAGGRELRALERPGLWNGSMAGWNTLFIEMPMAAFNPVKTVNVLLQDNHQG